MAELLFYKKPVPIDKNVHKNTRFVPVSNHGFAAETNSVPLAAVEFKEAGKEYPIIFIKTPAEKFVAVALVGIREKENLFIDENNKWDASYIPAYVRRYPFVLSTTPKENEMVICIDEEYVGFDNPAGEPLLQADGEPSHLLSETMKLVKEFHEHLQRTESFVKQLEEYGLLKNLNATVGPPGREAKLTGFSVVDEKKLLQLDDEKILKLFKSGQLGLIYFHMASLANLGRLGTRLAKKNP
ncbi:MAG: SapC family protein [Thermodesulfobacteriota bacterium]|nr:SapC family protein [Thermodesulfobacteriota bacterium]